MKFVSCLPISAAFAASFIAAAPAQTLVPVPRFHAIELRGGGHVMLRHGSVQQVRLVKGSIAFTRFVVDERGKLRIDACNRDCPHRYDLEIAIVSPRIDALAVSGGGAIDSSGGFPRPRTLALAVEGGGTIDARAMESEGATAAVDGGGVIRVKATGELTAAIHGGGKVRYWGNPRVTQAIDGGGTLERGN